MHYYHVLVRSAQYRGDEPLTYAYPDDVEAGSIVRVPLRGDEVLGISLEPVNKPDFQTKMIVEVLDIGPLPKESLRLARWVQTFYKSPLGVVGQLFLPEKLTKIKLNQGYDHKEGHVLSTNDPPLTDEQQSALLQMQTPDTFLLHGRTGSGKTRLYKELTKVALAEHRSVIILSPEIGLTSQLAANFTNTFGPLVYVIHSQLKESERRAVWLRIHHSKLPVIVIGPRSALFSPVHDLGLIVIDESHDQSYKQEQPPYYHAVRVASQLRKLHGAKLILGSATPSVTDYYLATQKNKAIIRLEHLAIRHSHSREVTIVDIKDRSQFLRSRYLSDTLIRSVEKSLKQGEQSLLYLNRRGTARMVICENCGWVAICPNCDVSFIYHADEYTLRCHTCGQKQDVPLVCQSCSSPNLQFQSFGTKAIVENISRLFPEAKVVRLDTDTAKSDRLEQQYQNIVEGNTNIIIGTQMITKGLDLPRLSTLGVLVADSSLSLPDYTAEERTFQLLTQVVGRIGRGHVESRAVIQTYEPDSKLLSYVLNEEWDRFYNDQIKERKTYLFPPFVHLLKLTCRRKTSDAAERAAIDLRNRIATLGLLVAVIGPMPSFREKVGGLYRWQLILKAHARTDLLKITAILPSGNWSYDLDPSDLL